MKLEEFFRQVDACPDKIVTFPGSRGQDKKPNLYWEFGIYDNFSLVSLSNRDELRQIISQVPDFKYRHTDCWTYQDRPVIFTLGDRGNPWFLTYGIKVPQNAKERKHDLWQRSCNSMIVFNDTSDDMFKSGKTLAEAIRSLTKVLSNQGIQFCLPNSLGGCYYYRHRPPSRIVYSPDSLEEEMNK